MWLKDNLAVMIAIHIKHKGSIDLKAIEGKVHKWLTYVDSKALPEFLYARISNIDMVHSFIAEMSKPIYEDLFISCFDEMLKFLEFVPKYSEMYLEYAKENFDYIKDKIKNDAEIEPFIQCVLRDEYDVIDDFETPLVRESDFDFILEQVEKALKD